MSKITYRDSFIKALESEIRKAKSMCYFFCLAETAVERTERATNTRLTKSSPKPFYNKLAVTIGNSVVSETKVPHDARQAIARSIVENAQAAANNKQETEAPKAVLLGADFNHLIDCLKAVKPYASLKDSLRTYVELIVGKDEHGNGQVTAVVTDGYRILKHKCACCLRGHGFTTFIKIPKVKPGKYDVVSITPDDEGVTISFDNVSLRYQAPPVTDSFALPSKIYNDNLSGRENMATLDVDVNLLKGLLNGLVAGKNNAGDKRVTLVVGKNQEFAAGLPYLWLEMADSEAFVLPLRPISKH